MRKFKFPYKALRWVGVVCAMLVLLTAVITVYAADPYWMGHKWYYGKAAYRIKSSVPAGFHDDIANAAAKWSEPSPLYFYRMYSEVPPMKGGTIEFGDPPWWSIAYTYVYYRGSWMAHYRMIFDADVPQGWTDAPCGYWWDSRLRVFSVALHELGHAVDFKSVWDTNTVMYTQYRCYTSLYQRDKNAIDDLY